MSRLGSRFGEGAPPLYRGGGSASSASGKATGARSAILQRDVSIRVVNRGHIREVMFEALYIQLISYQKACMVAPLCTCD